MSGTVLPFTGPWRGRFEPAHGTFTAQLCALADARLILAAKQAADDWMSVMLIGLLASMDRPHLLRLELAIGTHADRSEASQQALALIRLANGDKDYRARVLCAVEALQGRGA